VERFDVAVIGAGQAGLSVSHELSALGIENVVLERGRTGETWRGRWDSFCLVTPNWTVQLPGGHYTGGDPDGFMPRDEVVAHLARYAADLAADVREGVDVAAIEPRLHGFDVQTSSGPLHAAQVVLATGAYQRPHRPPAAATLPAGLPQLDVEGFRNVQMLPPGGVLIVGSGQSGCQIAEELREAGREVFLASGKAPWAPRRMGGHDLVWWAVETGFLDAPVESLPDPSARLSANILATGHGGGHDLSLRTLRSSGVTLLGHFLGAADGVLRFAPDLTESVAWGDERYRNFMAMVSRTAVERGWDPPEIIDPDPFDGRSPERLDLSAVGSVIFSAGFRPDYSSWLPWPEAFDEFGFPIHRDGGSTIVPGIWFVGVHFMRKRKSSVLIGVGEDASVVAAGIARAARSNAASLRSLRSPG
jgi:putative flavoprotein involved in K+ transport